MAAGTSPSSVCKVSSGISCSPPGPILVQLIVHGRRVGEPVVDMSCDGVSETRLISEEGNGGWGPR